MTIAEIVLSIITGVGGLVWVGNVIIKKIEAKNNVDLKRLDNDHQKVEDLKNKLQDQHDTIRDQNDTIVVLRHQISAMQLKINIIVPMLRKVLKDDPDNAEILDHLETFDMAANKTPNG